MQEQLKTIVKRFKQCDFYSLISNKQNNSRFQPNNKDFVSKQQYIRWSRQQKIFKDMFQSLIADGNRLHLCYEEILRQYTNHIEALKQELNESRKLYNQERLETEKILIDLNEKINNLNKQIGNKEENYKEIAEKYEQLIEQANEAHLQESKHVKLLQSQRLRESIHYQEEIKISFKQIGQTKKILSEAMQNNQLLLQQNFQLKKTIANLIENNQYLKEKLESQKSNKLIRVQNIDEQQHSFEFMQQEDVQSVNKRSKFGLNETVKMNNSQEINFIDEKQVLNISEHYSKFNRTQEMHVREKSSQFDFCDNRSVVRKYQTNNEIIAKINELFQKQSILKDNSFVIQQQLDINQDKHQDTYKVPNINPYHAFFQLLVQCQKLNSPHFLKIADIDISYLYLQFIDKYIPYNLWQVEIKKTLESTINPK